MNIYELLVQVHIIHWRSESITTLTNLQVHCWKHRNFFDHWVDRNINIRDDISSIVVEPVEFSREFYLYINIFIYEKYPQIKLTEVSKYGFYVVICTGYTFHMHDIRVWLYCYTCSAVVSSAVKGVNRVRFFCTLYPGSWELVCGVFLEKFKNLPHVAMLPWMLIYY